MRSISMYPPCKPMNTRHNINSKTTNAIKSIVEVFVVTILKYVLHRFITSIKKSDYSAV